MRSLATATLQSTYTKHHDGPLLSYTVTAAQCSCHPHSATLHFTSRPQGPQLPEFQVRTALRQSVPPLRLRLPLGGAGRPPRVRGLHVLVRGEHLLERLKAVEVVS